MMSETKMRQRIELLSEVVFETDGSGVLRFLNNAWRVILGYEVAASLGTSLVNYVLPADRHSFENYIARARGGHAGEPVELRLKCKNGAVVPMELSTTPLDETGWVGTLHNLTQRNLAKAELARLSLVASYTDSLVVITNARGEIEWVNNAFAAKTEFSLEECVGCRPGALLQGPETDTDTVQSFRRALREAKSFQCEILNYSKSGKKYWVAIFVTPIFDQHGRLERFISIQNDVTAVRQMQEELQTAKEAAEQANRAKSVFLAAMSHEIRTPLNGVLGMISVLEQGPLEQEQRERAGIIRKSGEALVSIVGDILDYSKIEAGRLTLSSDRFEAAAVLQDALDLFKGTAETQGIRLSARYEGDHDGFVVGDRGRIRQVLMNLVSNALKFTPSGEVRVEMTERRNANAAEVEVRVTDTGIGIRSQDLDRLFVHFSQLDDSSTRTVGGTGLGLAISKQLVEMMGGEIGVESNYGAGSTFWFRLSMPWSLNQPTEIGSAADSATLDLRGMRALIAEDNDVNQIVLTDILTTLGCQVDSAANGIEAVARVSATPYDFVMMDIYMPEMDGREATRRIRQFSSVPVIAVTANVAPQEIENCRASGMNGFVSKPINRSAIEAEVSRVLASEHPERPSALPIQTEAGR